MNEIREITQAIAAFEKNPTDDAAQDISLATQLPSTKAFLEAADGVRPSDRLVTAFMLADITLDAAPSRSALTHYYSKLIRWRALSSLLRSSGHTDAVQELLDNPPQFSYLTDDYKEK